MSIYKRRSGKWAAVICIDPAPTGATRRRSLGTFGTRKEAERAERDALSSRDRGIDLAPRSVTVADLLRRYLEDCATRVESTTIVRYRGLADHLILPHIGEKTLARLRPAHLAEWIAKLRECGGQKGKPLSAKTVRHAIVLLNGAIKWAVKLQLAATNPVAAVGVPPVPRSKARALAPEEIARVLELADKTRWGPFVTLAFATGMRRGELCALEWSDIDLEQGTVLVERSLAETPDGAILKATKTDRIRTVPLSRMAVSALRRQRAMQAADRLRAGAGGFRDDTADPLFTNEIGERIAPMDATHAYARIAKEAKAKSLRLHDARHSAATHLLVAGVDIRSVSDILGHASANTTLGTYAHLVANAQRDGIDKLGDRLAAIVDGARKSS